MRKILYHLKIFLFGIGEVFNQWRWAWSSKNDVHDIEILGGHRFKFTHFGTIAEMLFSRQHLVSRSVGGFEQTTLALFAKELKMGDTMLDIGANVGMFSLLGAKIVGNSGKIYAFEPSSDTFSALKTNLALNVFEHIVEPQQMALSDQNGVIKLAMSDDAYKFMDKNATQGEEVPMLKLDDWAAKTGIERLHFIKIDIEGAELLCFKGGEETLRKFRPIIIMECDDRWTQRFGYSVADVIQFLANLGYRFENYDFSQWICYPK